MTFDEWYATQRHQLSNEQVCRVIWEASAREENEACAKVCEDEACGGSAFNSAAKYMAERIRARRK